MRKNSRWPPYRAYAVASCIDDEPCRGDHSRSGRRLAFDGSLVRRVLLKGIVNPVLMVVVHVLADEAPQVDVAECDQSDSNLREPQTQDEMLAAADRSSRVTARGGVRRSFAKPQMPDSADHFRPFLRSHSLCRFSMRPSYSNALELIGAISAFFPKTSL